MRSLRLLLSAGGLVAAVAAATACGAARASASGVWVEVSPSSITAGFQVGVRADCGDNSNAATVTSKAFGTVTVQPLNSILQAEAHVPENTPAGGFDVTLTCKTGSTATTTLWVVNKGGGKSMGPHTGGGYLAHGPRRGLADELTGPRLWLAGGVGALGVSAVIGAVSVRRRRRRGAAG
jgi:hypothetical protein